MAFGTDPTPDGLANPPIDDLMKHADSKYALAIFAAKRARQINSYFTQLNEGLLQNIGLLVEYQNNEKPRPSPSAKSTRACLRRPWARTTPTRATDPFRQFVWIVWTVRRRMMV